MLTSLIGYSKYIKGRNVTISNFTFRLITKLNFTIFMCLVAIFSVNTYFGDPIHCTEVAKVPASHSNNFCWLMGVYVQSGFVGTLLENATDHGFGHTNYRSEKVYLRYYQWMVFIYFFYWHR